MTTDEIVIEGSTASWDLRAEGPIEGTYAGKFRFKCYLTPSQEIAANREYRELLGANPLQAPEHVSFLAYALTQLKHRIVSAPPFWDATKEDSISGDVADHEIISKVLDAAIAAEEKYRKSLVDRKKEALEKAKAEVQRIMDRERQESIDDDESEETDNQS